MQYKENEHREVRELVDLAKNGKDWDVRLDAIAELYERGFITQREAQNMTMAA